MVIVDADNIGGDTLPAVVPDYGAGGVEGLGEVVKSLYVVALGWIVGEIGHAPTLIKRDPRDDAGMAIIAVHHIDPLASEPLDGLLGVAIRAGHLLPNEQAEGIGPIQVTRVFNFLVLARPIETHVLSELHIFADG